ncbi:MAG: DEAD/DEAH box helicase [Euryarchaeota archaeon]|nr:DEAD/DEAH box helicase [Euryarchaeota archaeon]MCL2676829.1 DEAD/DEAH box helicase [Streptococcaceae bacterium]
MSKVTLKRYAPFIREYIYRKKWDDLRPVQVDACNAILDTDNHLIIASGTASGKTEAAFFPILTTLYQKPANSIGIIYIGPLKALINDQFERLSGLLEENYIPVWPWHGEVSQSIKKRAIKEAQGVLQITPESLESLLMRRPGDSARLFADLRFVVIDEIHALMGIDRGLQTLCLLSRLERIAGCTPRRIGLSATLNDYSLAKQFLAAGTKREAKLVGTDKLDRTIDLNIESFILPGGSLPDDLEQRSMVLQESNDFIYQKSLECHDTKYPKCLIFVNSRSNAEEIIANMRKIATKRCERDIFHVHHGSIAAILRQDAETALRESGPTVAAATLTLELGIDIGELESTIQFGAPYSCASFVQRLGRSGRRSEKSKMTFVNLHEQNNQTSLDDLPWELLRSIAIIQLYLEERWVEPFILKKKPFSVLAHQTLSTVMTYGELTPPELAKKVLTLPAFQNTISQDEYRDLLRHMVENDYLERIESGTIIVGLKGERITNHYSFFAVFQDEQVYRVHSKDGEIGTLSACPIEDEAFVLAGRPWKVQSVNEERKIIYVEPVKGGHIPRWNGGSCGDIHTRIVQRMRQVLLEDSEYPDLKLNPNALNLLQDARCFARETDILQRSIIPISEKSFLLCPWVGTREIRTIHALLTCGLKDALQIKKALNFEHYLEIISGLPLNDFVQVVKSLDIIEYNPDYVLPKGRAPKIDKYDVMVPDELLRKAYLYNEMDIVEAIQILKTI